MKSASLLAKASFVLLVLILGCLIYLIARDRERARAQARQASDSFGNTQDGDTRSAEGEQETRAPQVAPLRPRASTNSAQRPAPAQPAEGIASAKVKEDTVDPAAIARNDSVAAAEIPPVSFAAFAGSSSSSGAASVSGRITLRGTPPPEVPITLDPMCARTHPQPMTTRHFVVGEGGGLGNVFVYIKSGVPAVAAPTTGPLLDQVRCEYQPFVLGVQAGQPLVVRNSDPFLHNVHTLPVVNTPRNLGQPVRGQTNIFRFTRPEVLVKFKCDVHAWMFAYVGVVSHPWFAVTDASGNFQLPAGLPTGRYTVAAVHPKLGEMTQEVMVSESPSPVEFSFTVPDVLTKAGQ
jgi:hypothetical protein